ncbi:JNK-interacting protein 1, partial [Gryllus bimaculatus]
MLPRGATWRGVAPAQTRRQTAAVRGRAAPARPGHLRVDGAACCAGARVPSLGAGGRVGRRGSASTPEQRQRQPRRKGRVSSCRFQLLVNYSVQILTMGESGAQETLFTRIHSAETQQMSSRSCVCVLNSCTMSTLTKTPPPPRRATPAATKTRWLPWPRWGPWGSTTTTTPAPRPRRVPPPPPRALAPSDSKRRNASPSPNAKQQRRRQQPRERGRGGGGGRRQRGQAAASGGGGAGRERGLGPESVSSVAAATPPPPPPWASDVRPAAERRPRRRLPEIPKNKRPVATRALSLADELGEALERSDSPQPPVQFAIGGQTRPLLVLKCHSYLRDEDSSPDSERFHSTDVDSGNSTAHSPDGPKSSSPPPPPLLGRSPSPTSPASPASAASSGSTPFPQLELLEATHRGLHKFIPRHIDEIEVEIGDPIYPKDVPCHDYFYSLKNVSFCAFHPRDHRYMGFITKHPQLQRFACHVFVGQESTRPVAEAVGIKIKLSSTSQPVPLLLTSWLILLFETKEFGEVCTYQYYHKFHIGLARAE